MIELIMVIIIIGIIASVSLPKFVNLKTKALDNTEAALLGAMSTATKALYTQNIVTGSTAWPADMPMSLVTPMPPFRVATYGEQIVPDGVNWRFYHNTNLAWYIMCPHWNGDYGGGGSPSKGQMWIYSYNWTAWSHLQGDFWKWWGPVH